MAYLTLNTDKLKQNYIHLDTLFKRRGIQWSVVSKLLCGNETYLKALMDLGIEQVCDSRIAHLKKIKALYPEVETIFIKPPAKRNAQNVVAYADISFNTSLATIKALSAAAQAMNKMHRIVIMVESGELREGVMQKDLLSFYDKVFRLPNIEVIGLGTNLTCMYGVLPDYDKLEKLVYYKTQIEATFGVDLPYISGGASVTIPLLHKNELPEDVNHFRVGETLFFGTDVYHNSDMKDMHQDLFMLYGEIIELQKKPNIPDGELGYNLTGEKKTFDQKTGPEQSYRAIIDAGLLDIDPGHMQALDTEIKIAGASSDMTVLDLGDNEQQYKVGDKIPFRVDYMGALRALNSKYVEKRIESYSKALRIEEPVIGKGPVKVMAL